MAPASTDVIAVVLDIGPLMVEAPDGTSSPLQHSVEMVDVFLQRKIFSESKDRVALFLLGSDVTDNRMATGGDFARIQMVFPLQSVSWEMCQFVQEQVQSGSETGDLIDAIIVAGDLLAKEKTKGTKRIMIMSSLNCNYNTAGLDSLISDLEENSIELNFVGPTLGDDDDTNDTPTTSQSTQPSCSRAGPSSSTNHQQPRPSPQSKPKTAMQKHGEAVIRKMTKKLDIIVYGYRDATSSLMHFEGKAKGSRAWSVDLKIGPSIRIAVSGFIKIKREALPSFKLCHASNPGRPIVKATDYSKTDEKETEVEKSEICSGYKYGQDTVPFTEEDKIAMKYSSEEASCQVLAFAKRKAIKRWHYSGDGTMVFYSKKGNKTAAMAFSALVKALSETKMVAIVRRVYNRNSAPVMGVLYPEIDSDHQALHYMELPYFDDVRQFVFGSLPISDNVSVNQKYKPSKDQLDAVDSLITELDLDSEEKEDIEHVRTYLEPHNRRNPTLQRLFQCLQHRAFHETWALPPIAPALQHLLEQTETATAADRLQKAFTLEPGKKGKKDTANVFKAMEVSKDEIGSKRSREDDDVKVDLKKPKVLQIGSVDPVGDFKTLVEREPEEKFPQVCEDMIRMIKHLVMDSFGESLYSQALACIKELRSHCVKKDPSLFNVFLTELKGSLKESNRKSFWNQLTKERLSLIHVEENGKSEYEKKQAVEFMVDQSSQPKQEETLVLSEDEDDLLDAM